MKKTGFTLIELLVVIAILGILGSLVVSTIIGACNRIPDAPEPEPTYQTEPSYEVEDGKTILDYE
jgi:prepilin-type N-terminal cleavage/methylation domain-containing protein